MPITASWHTTLNVPTADPFSVPERIEDVGVPINLAADGRSAELRRERVDALEREAKLDAAGHRCEIKDNPETTCYACPLYRDTDELCQSGRTQERVCTELRVISLGGRRQ